MVKTKRLQQFVVSSWLMSGLMAVVASLLLFSIFGYYSYNQSSRISQQELNEKTLTAARRISGELLIAPRGSPDAVALQLQKELKLDDLQFGSFDHIQSIKRNSNFLYSEVKMPFLETKYAVLASVPKSSVLNHFNIVSLIICCCLIGLIVGSGLFFQTKHFNKHLIKPIESLVDISTGDKIACEHWPVELQEISQKLSSSFQQREQVVYNQMARGVIHDIKTILQSLQVATDLASESQSEARLQNLLKVSKAKLPSLLSIIDTTLDGSREISVKTKNSNLTETLNKSIEVSKTLPVAKNITMETSEIPSSFSMTHDPIQMERVFTNLIKNALEAVDIKTDGERKIKIAFSVDEKDFASVIVEDSGMGLPKQPDSVFRLLKSTKTHGSGLGLLVSRKIVEAHNGQLIAAHSDSLKGAKFEVKLPLKEVTI